MSQKRKHKLPDVGQQFHDWTVIDNNLQRFNDGKNKGRGILVTCKCGTEKRIWVHHLYRGISQGCQSCRRNHISKGRYQGVGNISGRQFSLIRCSAIDRNIEFSITKEYIWSLYLIQDGKCALSGQDISIPKHDFVNFSNNKKPKVASLDRIDSTNGYIEGNVQWVHKNINFMKNAFSQIEFIKLCRLVTEHNIKK